MLWLLKRNFAPLKKIELSMVNAFFIMSKSLYEY